MTPQELKNSIIKLALEGKLVKVSDSSGIDLYNKIIDHKKELKIANKKHLDSNSESFPFDIPENWKWCRFGEVVDYRMGKTPPRAESEWWANDIPWISIADMIENGYVSNTKEKVSNNALRIKFGGNISPKGTLIMSFKLTVGRVSILDIDAVHNEAIISIFPYIDESNTFRNYLFYVLPFLSQFGETKGAIKGNTLNDTSLCNLPIPLPSFEEQKRIVAKIEELLPLVDRYEEAWKKLELLNVKFPVEIEKSIIQAGLKGKLVEHNPLYNGNDILIEIDKYKKNHKIKDHKAITKVDYDCVPFEIPDNWAWCKLGSISSYAASKEKVNASQIKPEWWSLDLEDIEKETGNIVTICKAKDRKITGDKTIFKKGQILYSKLRPYLKKILIAPNDGICSPELVPFDIYGDINSKYLMYVLKSPHVDNEINAVTYGVKMPRVGTETMANLLIPLPPLEEQERIVAKIEELLPLCRKLIK